MALGKWNIILKAMGQQKEGVLDFDNLKAEAMGAEFPIEELKQNEEVLTFNLINQGKAIKFAVKVDGDTFEGKAKFGPLPMGVTGTKAE